MSLSSTDRLLVANLRWNHKLFHCHHVHWCEVPGNSLLATFPSTLAEVLFQVDGELGYHNGVLHVRLNPLKSFNTFLASVRFSNITYPSSLTNMDSAIDQAGPHNGSMMFLP